MSRYTKPRNIVYPLQDCLPTEALREGHYSLNGRASPAYASRFARLLPINVKITTKHDQISTISEVVCEIDSYLLKEAANLSWCFIFDYCFTGLASELN